jgi:tryptophan synthase alpha chain
MTRIDEKFKQLKKKGEKAFIPFFFAGDPDILATYKLVLEAEKAGADIIELGVPYSDPLADGPVNQAASARALKNGVRLKDVFSLVSDLRRATQVPILFLLYFNCIMQYGVERFLSACAEAGVDGLVIPDLPYEEKVNYKNVFDRYPVDIIPFIAPASQERTGRIVEDARGFVYCVTSSGVTGVRGGFETDFASFMKEVERFTALPKVLGFGISTTGQAKELKGFAQGIIVGSAIVRLIEGSDSENLVPNFSKLIREYKDVLR